MADNGNMVAKAALYVGVFAVASLSLLYTFQDKMLYIPGVPIRYTHENPAGYHSPDDRKMNYQDVELDRGHGVVLRGWYMKHLGADPRSRRLIVFFHENAGNLGLRLDYFQQLYHVLGVDILAFAYRGYSDSTGEPTEEGLKSDAHAIMKYVKDRLADTYVDKGGIFLLGRSLGGAVATEALTDDSKSMIDGIILENTFTSIPDMVDHIFVLVRYVKGLILRIGWNTVDLVPDITAPIFFVTGKEDEIVPYEQTIQLYDAATSARFKDLFVVEEGTHNDTWSVKRE